jgi:hypothetical protein
VQRPHRQYRLADDAKVAARLVAIAVDRRPAAENQPLPARLRVHGVARENRIVPRIHRHVGANGREAVVEPRGRRLAQAKADVGPTGAAADAQAADEVFVDASPDLLARVGQLEMQILAP